MQAIDVLMTIEQDFIQLLKALPLIELQFNGRLRHKTGQMAKLMALVARLRKEVQAKLVSDVQKG